jgi:RNA polymerase sigma-70 factor (ECF subfamily)
MDFNTIPWHTIRKELKTFVNRKVRNTAIADDVVQEIILKVHGRLNTLREPSRLRAWIFQVARNTITDHFRSAGKTVESVVEVAPVEEQPNSFNDCMANCLHEEMKALPAKYKEALELSDVNSLPQIELSERLQLSYSGVKSRVQRARAILRMRMDRKYIIQTDSYGNIIVCENRQSGCC